MENGKLVKKGISLPDLLLQIVDASAKEHKENRTSFINKSLEKFLDEFELQLTRIADGMEFSTELHLTVNGVNNTVINIDPKIWERADKVIGYWFPTISNLIAFIMTKKLIDKIKEGL